MNDDDKDLEQDNDEDEDSVLGDDEESKSVGDTDISGQQASLDSDDDAGEAAQKMGLYPDETEEVGIDEQTRRAEKEHQEED